MLSPLHLTPPALGTAGRRAALAACLAVLGLLTTACSSTPEVLDTVKAAKNQPAVELKAWWLPFDDLLLQQLIEQALQSNQNIRKAQGVVQQARAMRDVRLAANRFQLAVSGSAQRNAADDAPTSISFRSGLDAAWELDVFGANRSALATSEAELLVAKASLRDVQLSISTEVALAYIDLRGLQAKLAIARQNLLSQQETLQITRWRVQAGLATSLDQEQAQAAVSQTAAQIPALQSSLAKARHSLGILTGQQPKTLDALLSASGPVPMAPIELANEIAADNLRQRADVRAAEERILAAHASIAAAQATRLPRFKLGGSVGLTALTLGGLTGAANMASAVLASVTMPVLDGGALEAQVKLQMAVLEQNQAAYQNTLLTAFKEVEDALIALRNDRERLAHLERSASAAGHAALLAQNRYASGLIDFQTVLQTQRTLFNAQDSVASVQTDLGTDHVRLIKALGGGW